MISFPTSSFLFVYGLAIFSESYFFLSCRSFTCIPLPTLICLSHFYSILILHLSPQQAPTLPTPISVCLFLSVIVSLVLRRAELENQLNWPEQRPRYYHPAGIHSMPPLSPPQSAFIPHSVPPSSSTKPPLRKLGENLKNTSRANRNPKIENNPSL